MNITIKKQAILLMAVMGATFSCSQQNGTNLETAIETEPGMGVEQVEVIIDSTTTKIEDLAAEIEKSTHQLDASLKDLESN